MPLPRVAVVVSQLGYGGAERQTLGLLKELSGTPWAPRRVICLSENVARGQRIARYTLEGAEREDDAWRNISSGSTIGYAKLDRFPSTRVRRIRLTIEDAVSTPEAVSIKLFA